MHQLVREGGGSEEECHVWLASLSCSESRRGKEMSGIAQGLVTHRMACSEQPQPVVLWGRPSSSGRWKPDRVAVWPVAGGAASHQLASTDLLPLSRRPGCSSYSTTRRPQPAASQPPWSSPPATAPSTCQDCRRIWGWGPALCCRPTCSRLASPRWPQPPSSWMPTCALVAPQLPAPPQRPPSHALPCCP